MRKFFLSPSEGRRQPEERGALLPHTAWGLLPRVWKEAKGVARLLVLPVLPGATSTCTWWLGRGQGPSGGGLNPDARKHLPLVPSWPSLEPAPSSSTGWGGWRGHSREGAAVAHGTPDLRRPSVRSWVYSQGTCPLLAWGGRTASQGRFVCGGLSASLWEGSTFPPEIPSTIPFTGAASLPGSFPKSSSPVPQQPISHPSSPHYGPGL